MTLYEQARDKLNSSNCNFANRDKAFLVPYIREALLVFAFQSEKFAEAILSDKKTLTGCINSLTLVGKRASDLDVYNECVRYYIPDSIVEFEMKIKVPTEKGRGAIILKLEDFLN